LLPVPMLGPNLAKLLVTFPPRTVPATVREYPGGLVDSRGGGCTARPPRSRGGRPRPRRPSRRGAGPAAHLGQDRRGLHPVRGGGRAHEAAAARGRVARQGTGRPSGAGRAQAGPVPGAHHKRSLTSSGSKSGTAGQGRFAPLVIHHRDARISNL